MSERLAEIMLLIMDGVCRKFGINGDARADAQQEFVAHMLTRRKKMDPSRNCFSYLTTTATHLLWLQHRKRFRYRSLGGGIDIDDIEI